MRCSVQATQKLYRDGLFQTGDIMEQIAADQIRWVDRRSNIIKLAQGEFVSVSRLESDYMGGSMLIYQMFIYGSSLRSYLLATIVPSPGAPHISPAVAGQDPCRGDSSASPLCRYLRPAKILTSKVIANATPASPRSIRLQGCWVRFWPAHGQHFSLLRQVQQADRLCGCIQRDANYQQPSCVLGSVEI